MKRRDLIVNGVLGITVIGLGTGAYFAISSPAKASTGTGTRTATVTTGDVTATVAANGNVASGSDTTVGATDCSGKITSVKVQLGQRVKAGQLLATIDSTTADQALATAQANLTSAENSQQSNVANAQASLDQANAAAALDKQQSDANMATTRAAISADEDAVSAAKSALTAAKKKGVPQDIASAQQSLTQAESTLTKDEQTLTQQQQQRASTDLKDSQQVGSAQRQLTQAQNGSGSGGGSNLVTAQQSVDNAKKAVADCSLTAPTTGTITTLSAVVGGSSGGSSGGSGNSSASSTSGLFVISDVATMKVTAAFSEADVATIRTGQSATITFSALTDASNPSGISTDGSVQQIAPTSTVSSGVVTYNVTIMIPSPPTRVRLGQTANVTVTTASKQNVLRVPSNAISTVGPLKTVQVVNGTSTTATTVQTGITGGGFTEITSGVTDGQTVQLPTQSTGTTTGTFGGRGLGGIGSAVGGP